MNKILHIQNDGDKQPAQVLIEETLQKTKDSLAAEAGQPVVNFKVEQTPNVTLFGKGVGLLLYVEAILE